MAGHPSPEETAALTAMLSALQARAQGTQPAARVPATHWADRARLLRGPVHPGPGGWRRSAQPR